jgi:hypothetical protein
MKSQIENIQKEIQSLDAELEKQLQEQEDIQETKLSKLISDPERYKIESASLQQKINEIIKTECIYAIMTSL